MKFEKRKIQISLTFTLVTLCVVPNIERWFIVPHFKPFFSSLVKKFNKQSSIVQSKIEIDPIVF